MKKIIIAGLLVGAAVTLAPVASADNGYTGTKGDHDGTAYWLDINDALPGRQTSSHELGLTICDKLGDGFAEQRLTDIVLGAGPVDMTMTDAQYVVYAAEYHFCPSFY